MKLRELRVTYHAHPSGLEVDPRLPIRNARDAAVLLLPLYEGAAAEYAKVLLLDTHHKLIAIYELGHGGIKECTIDPYTVFRAALLCSQGPATAIVLSHNHPSGDPTPSPQDIDITRRLVAGGYILNIEVVDHIIIGTDTYCSLKETGRL